MVSGDANLLIKILSKSSHILTVDNQLKVTKKNIVKTAVLRKSSTHGTVPPSTGPTVVLWLFRLGPLPLVQTLGDKGGVQKGFPVKWEGGKWKKKRQVLNSEVMEPMILGDLLKETATDSSESYFHFNSDCSK